MPGLQLSVTGGRTTWYDDTKPGRLAQRAIWQSLIMDYHDTPNGKGMNITSRRVHPGLQHQRHTHG